MGGPFLWPSECMINCLTVHSKLGSCRYMSDAAKRMLPLAPASQLSVTTTPSPRFDHPQVLLLGVEPESAAMLREAGFNVTTGSFGVPYRVPLGDRVVPVIPNGALPDNYGEQEIVVIDLVPRTVL